MNNCVVLKVRRATLVLQAPKAIPVRQVLQVPVLANRNYRVPQGAKRMKGGWPDYPAHASIRLNSSSRASNRLVVFHVSTFKDTVCCMLQIIDLFVQPR